MLQHKIIGVMDVGGFCIPIIEGSIFDVPKIKK